MNKGLRRGATIMLLPLFIAGCANTIGTGSKIAPGPVGIGPAINEMKGTPCACTEIPMAIPAEMQV